MDNYTATFSIDLSSQYVKTVPVVKVTFDTEEVFNGPVDSKKRITFTSMPKPAGTYELTVEFFNKDYTEFVNYNKDMMVSVNAVHVEQYPYNFAIHSIYSPDYPEPWKSEQQQAGVKLDEHIHSNYLGWNGTWQLNIQLPIYRWIHKTVNLGWLI